MAEVTIENRGTMEISPDALQAIRENGGIKSYMLPPGAERDKLFAQEQEQEVLERIRLKNEQAARLANPVQEVNVNSPNVTSVHVISGQFVDQKEYTKEYCISEILKYQNWLKENEPDAFYHINKMLGYNIDLSVSAKIKITLKDLTVVHIYFKSLDGGNNYLAFDKIGKTAISYEPYKSKFNLMDLLKKMYSENELKNIETVTWK